MIFPIYNDDGEWFVEAANNREVKRGDFEDVAQWVIDNYIMLQNIRKKAIGINIPHVTPKRRIQ